MTKKNNLNDFLYGVFIFGILIAVGYYAILGYVNANNTKVQYDFEDIQQANFEFSEIGELNSFVLTAGDNSTIYSVLGENLSFTNNIDRLTINESELDDFSVLFSYSLAVDGNSTNEELRIDSAPVNSQNASALAHSIEYDPVEQNYIVEVNGVAITFIEEYSVETTQGIEFIYDFHKSSGFVSVEVIKVDMNGDKQVLTNQVGRLSEEVADTSLVVGTQFWINYLLIGGEDTTQISVNEVSLTY